MIVCCGENVVDLVMRPDGSYHPVAGGSALNIALGLGRLGVAVGYAMPISADALGSFLLEALAAAAVRYLPTVRPQRPAGLAMVSVMPDGQPAYGFYRHGVADTDLVAGELPHLGSEVTHLHMGGSPSLGHDVSGDMLVEWAKDQDVNLTVSLDPNVRPDLVADRGRFLARCDLVLERCSVCRLSVEDAQYMFAITDPDATADLLLSRGVLLAVVTQGDKGAVLATAATRVNVNFPAPAKVQDTVGAGDTFMSALLAELSASGKLAVQPLAALSKDELWRFGRFATAAAAINCTRKGCVPATRQEVCRLLAGG